jgi:hypothetical protein
MDRISKRELRAALGVETDAEVAAFYDISPAAVSQWGEDAPIPELRQLQALGSGSRIASRRRPFRRFDFAFEPGPRQWTRPHRPRVT